MDTVPDDNHWHLPVLGDDCVASNSSEAASLGKAEKSVKKESQRQNPFLSTTVYSLKTDVTMCYETK